MIVRRALGSTTPLLLLPILNRGVDFVACTLVILQSSSVTRMLRMGDLKAGLVQRSAEPAAGEAGHCADNSTRSPMGTARAETCRAGVLACAGCSSLLCGKA